MFETARWPASSESAVSLLLHIQQIAKLPGRVVRFSAVERDPNSRAILLRDFKRPAQLGRKSAHHGEPISRRSLILPCFKARSVIADRQNLFRPSPKKRNRECSSALRPKYVLSRVYRSLVHQQDDRDRPPDREGLSLYLDPDPTTTP